LISIYFHVEPEAADELIAELWEVGTSGITEESGGLRAFFEDREVIPSLLARFEQFDPVASQEEDHDWEQEVKDSWPPYAVGERLWVVPEWRDDPPPPGRLRLTSYPGMACGTGSHPATQLCLAALEKIAVTEKRVLDVGTGTGILAEAALLLGARSVFGCDIDHAATVVAKTNMAKSGLHVPVFTGSLRSVRSGAVNRIVGNLNAVTLEQTASEMLRVTEPGGRLAVSGFRDDEVGRVEAAFHRKFDEVLEQDGWACGILNAG
jgi:ribosomal protein L11 methyltransferase